MENDNIIHDDEHTILQRLNIEALSDMQFSMRNAMFNSKHDVVLLSATGSGKTLAYLLPLVSMLNKSSDELQAVVIVPGRELAIQSDEVLKAMKCSVRSLPLYGGRPAMDEHKDIRKTAPHVIFATPGRLVDHLNKGNIKPYGVKYLVIDEFDKCLKMGFADEMKSAMKQLCGVKRKFLLSATDADEIPSFVNISSAERIDYTKGDNTCGRVDLYTIISTDKDKLGTLHALLCTLGDESSIVFLNYRDSVERTASFLEERGFTVSTLHGGMEQRQREYALYKFANGSATTLIATDLASRGLDLPQVDNIIHYHIPVGEDEYVHRTGRTARWEASGKAFFILAPGEEIPPYAAGARPYTLPLERKAPPRPRMVTLYIGKGKHDKISKGDVVGFLCKCGGLDGKDIGRIDVRERYTYAAVSYSKWHDVVMRASGEKLKGIKTVIELIK